MVPPAWVKAQSKVLPSATSEYRPVATKSVFCLHSDRWELSSLSGSLQQPCRITILLDTEDFAPRAACEQQDLQSASSFVRFGSH